MLDGIVGVIDGLSAKLDDAAAMLELAVEDDDESLLSDVQAELDDALNSVEELEFRRMFSGEMDANNCYLDIQSGSGGTEAQDWAQMLLRMYLRWCESHGFKAEVLEVSEGGAWQASNQQPLWLKVIMLLAGFALRLVCIAWCVSRLLTVITVAIPRLQRCLSRLRLMIILTLTSTPADLRIDTYRSSGAGGQHVNTTDSAVRITHQPTGVVVACQNERSQHANKDTAMKMLRAKLYELEMQKRMEKQQALEESKSDIGWGSQIRSYVLDDSRIKDLRTGVETSNTTAVLNGDLDKFIEASLKSRVMT